MYRAYATDSEVTRYLSWRPHANVSETESFLELVETWWEEGREYTWAIETLDTSNLIGSIGIRNMGSTRQVGYVLARPYWGQGFMTEALVRVIEIAMETPEVFRFEGFCTVENLASARVMEKAGMTYEGTLRRFAVVPNLGPEPLDSKCFAKVR